MESKITSSVTPLPTSCKSTMEHMVQALEEEDRSLEIAKLDAACQTKVDALEGTLSQTLGKEIAVVAYEVNK